MYKLYTSHYEYITVHECLRVQEFMRKNRLAHEKCLNAWHPRFEAALEDRSVVPEIEPAPLPTPAGDEFDARPASACSSASSSASATPCKSARAVLDSIGRMQSARFNKHVQAALAASESNTGSALVSATTPVSPSKGAPDVGAGCTSISVPVTPAKGAPSPAANKLLAGISPALLDKVIHATFSSFIDFPSDSYDCFYLFLLFVCGFNE